MLEAPSNLIKPFFSIMDTKQAMNFLLIWPSPSLQQFFYLYVVAHQIKLH